MTKTVLRVLISSPGDVTQECDLAEKVITEVNRILGPNSPVFLQPIRAEPDIPPGIDTDPQAVINSQLPQFEVFVGIMWTRLGTPTPRAASGTVEEFESAIRRWKDNAPSVAVMFFFSQQSPQLDQIDPDQLAALRQFKESLSSRGVYYKDYQDQEQFRALLTIALARKAQEWTREDAGIKADVTVADEVQAKVTYVSEVDDEGDEDWLDLLALYEEAMGRSNESVNRMSAATQQLGARITEKTEQLQALVSEATPSPSKARRLVNDVADDLNIFARTLETELPIFRESWSMVMDRLPKLFGVWSELDLGPEAKEGAARARTQLVELSKTLGGSLDSLMQFRATIATVPRLTSQYKKASWRALVSMDDFLADLAKVRAFVTEFSA